MRPTATKGGYFTARSFVIFNERTPRRTEKSQKKGRISHPTSFSDQPETSFGTAANRKSVAVVLALIDFFAKALAGLEEDRIASLDGHRAAILRIASDPLIAILQPE